MKTNEQMIEDLLKRKELYDKKQVSTRRRIALISAALAIILIVSSVPIIAFVANKKSPAPEEVTEAVTDKQTETSGVDVTEEQTKTVTENVPETTEEITNNDHNTEYNNNGKIDVAVPIGTPDIITHRTRISGDEENDILYGREIHVWSVEENKFTYKPGYDVKVNIYSHEEVKEYEIESTRTESFEEKRAYMLVIPSESIELLSDDLILLDFEKAETCKTNIKFRYKEGYTNGRIVYRLFREEDGLKLYAHLDAYIVKNGLGGNYEVEYKFKGTEFRVAGAGEFSLATIKGYDFEQKNYNTRLKWIYTLAAEYFGDVDEDGKPLFESDPYMHEYYDSPQSYNTRLDYEKWHNSESQAQESRGESEESTLFSFSKESIIESNSKGNVLQDYNITLNGQIFWTDTNNTTHPAKNIEINIYNDIDTETVFFYSKK